MTSNTIQLVIVANRSFRIRIPMPLADEGEGEGRLRRRPSRMEFFIMRLDCWLSGIVRMSARRASQPVCSALDWVVPGGLASLATPRELRVDRELYTCIPLQW